ncbi:tRNA endonuclease ANKZF1 [Anabrus simplex]|uniref:tRNA endonuclease ANKZF1 n=1 Tax=Anabrus simplex TaxID=316456 RepID=UPI0035A32494
MEHQIISLFEGDDYQKLVEGVNVSVHSDEDIETDEDFSNIANEAVKCLKNLDISDRYACGTCCLEFQNVEEQRVHFKMGFHSYNIKQKIQGLSPISAENYYLLKEDRTTNPSCDVDTVDNSEESPEKRQAKNEEDSGSGDSDTPFLQTSNRTCRVYFVNSAGKCFSVYNCLLHKKNVRPSSCELIKSVQECHKNPLWIILITGGGHFAGAVFNGLSIIVHKTIHSYTVRSKQGSAQSKKDSLGRHPKSAGASLRRYNEESFSQHVQELLLSWKNQFAACNIIFYRAVGHNQKLLFGDISPIKKSDPRVRSIPVPSRKATFKEVRRIHEILSAVEVFDSREVYQRMTKREPPSPRVPKPRSYIDRAKPRKSPIRPLPYLAISESSLDDDDDDAEIIITSEAASLSVRDELQEFMDTLPAKNKRKQARRSKTRKGSDKGAAKNAVVKEELESNPGVSEVASQSELPSVGSPGCSLPSVLTTHLHKERGMGTVEPASSKVQSYPPSSIPAHPVGLDEDAITTPLDPLPETGEMETCRRDSEVQKRKKKRLRKKMAKVDKNCQAPEQEVVHHEDHEEAEQAEHTVRQSTSYPSCCQCSENLSGKIPFEYSNYKFCTIKCLKLHRINEKANK